MSNTSATEIKYPVTTRAFGMAIIVLSGLQLMVVLDGTVANLALAPLQADLGLSDAGRNWVLTSYALAFGGLMLLGGRLGDAFGRKKMFLAGVVLECRAAGCALIYVEGGTRAVTKYVRLMSQRINWRRKVRPAAAAGDDEDGNGGGGSGGDDDDDGDGDAAAAAAPALGAEAAGISAFGFGTGPGSVCELVWRGVAAQRHFCTPAPGVAPSAAATVANGELEPAFTWEEARSAAAARKAMAAKGLEHLWDAALHSHEAATAAAPEALGDDGGAGGGALVGEALLAHIQARVGTADGGALLGAAAT